MFEDHFTPTIGSDHYYPIHEYTPAQGLREHNHDDVEDAIAAYTYNYEVIGTNTEGSRHSSRLFLVDDQYYVRSSRSGLESSGNTIWFSENTPEDLQFEVLDTVFNRVLQRQTDSIKTGDDTADDAEHLTVLTPRAFVLQTELSQDELREYYDTIAEYTFELIEAYNDVEEIKEFKEVVSEYNEKTKQLFRDAIDFEPSILYELFATQEYPEVYEGWRLPTDIDEATTLELCMHEETVDTENGTYTFFIELADGPTTNTITLSVEKDFDTDIDLFTYEFDTVDEVQWAFELCLSVSPHDVIIDDL